jgi:hypothetical protein
MEKGNYTFPMISEEEMQSSRRLLVLVPNQTLDESKLVQRIAALAFPNHLAVLLLDVIESANEEPAAYLRLANLSALIKAFSIENESKLVLGGNWIREVEETWREDDLVVCQAEQTIASPGIGRLPLSTVLSGVFDKPVLVLSGLYIETKPRKHTFLTEFAWWCIALIILITFSGFQFWIYQATQGWTNTVLLGLSFMIEISIIWQWNKIM